METKRITFTEDLLQNCIEQDMGGTRKTMLAEYDVVAKEDGAGYWLRGAHNAYCEVFDSEKALDENGGIHKDDIEKAKKLLNIDRSSNELVSATLRFCADEYGFKHYEITSKVLNNIEGKAVKLILIIRDVEEELKSKRKLWQMINYDKLTGLLNAEGFYYHAKKFMQDKAAGYFILSVDIKNFSLVNAVLGVETSNKILKELAELLKNSLGDNAVIGRIGADVFAVCITKEDALNWDYMIFRNGKYRSKIVNYELEFVTGIYEADNIEESVAHMYAKAKLAMREAKRKQASNIGYYEDVIENKYAEQQQIFSEKNEALKNGQFKVYLQPQCYLISGEIESAEALVRWQQPNGKMMQPTEFIPIFEESGFIKELDEYMLKEVCGLLLRWKEEGKRLIPISVNISRVDLFDPALAFKIKNIVDGYGIDPKYVELEITETAYMDSPQMMITTMEKLQNLGFKVIMDDFGSGYSSLNMLREVPVDKLKIDLKFMEGLDESEKGRDILRFIVNMAQTLSIITVAEGVERDEQLKILHKLGCDYAQGYLYSKPISITEFEEQYVKDELYCNRFTCVDVIRSEVKRSCV